MWVVSVGLKYLPNKSNNKHYFRQFRLTILTSRFQLNSSPKSIPEILQSRLTSFSKNIPMNRNVNLCQIRYQRLVRPRTSIKMSAWVTLKTTKSHFLFQLSSYSPSPSNRKRCPCWETRRQFREPALVFVYASAESIWGNVFVSFTSLVLVREFSQF